MMSPQISVIMSVYKEPIDWLRQSIGSILCQTFKDFEYIIICDNPQYADAIRLLKNYSNKDSRIRLIVNEENIGLTKSLNKGLAVAKGKYIARMDADDISMPERFDKQYHYMENNPSVVVLGTAIIFFGKGSLFKPTDGIRFGDNAIRAHMLLDNCIAHPTVFIRKSILDIQRVSYDDEYRYSQDYRLWEQLAPYGEFENLRDKLLRYRLSEQQITKSKSSSQVNLSTAIKLRWQKAWLAESGYNYTIEEINNNPFKIIDDLRKNVKISLSLQFSSFVQNAYLNVNYPHKLIRIIRNKEYHYIELMNLIRIVSRILLKK